MKAKSRIPRQYADFAAYLRVTDKLQLSVIDDIGTLRYTLWGWSAEHSNKWHDFFLKCEKLFALYSNPDKVNTSVRKDMASLVNTVQKYDHDATLGKRLLDKVALGGTSGDCATFKIKRSTAVAKATNSSVVSPNALQPRTKIRQILRGMHVLDIDEPTMPGTKARPDGVVAVLVCCHIGRIQPVSHRDYFVVGAASHGKFIYQLPNSDFSDTTLLMAYYHAVYLMKNGKLGTSGNVVSAIIIP